VLRPLHVSMCRGRFLFRRPEGTAACAGRKEVQEAMGVQKKASERKKATSCESCTFYAWDDEYEYYVCEADLDEDEMSSFLSGTDFSCPYYQPGDEYRIVRKQM
jgi:hypothetical protein